MKIHYILCLCFFATMSMVFAAPQRPVCDQIGEDLELTEGKSYKEFFTKRFEDEACRGKLKEAQKEFYDLRKAYQESVAKPAAKADIQKAYEKMETARETVLEKMDTCGECVAPEVTTVIIPGPPREIWYKSDGSCFVPPGDFKPDLQTLKTFLSTPQLYPKRNRGLRFLLEFMGIDHKDGTHLPNMGTAKASPFHGFMAVKAEIDPKAFVAFAYYIQSEFPEKFPDGKQMKQVLKFKTVPRPRGFQPPEIYDPGVTGKEKIAPALSISLTEVAGSWSADEEGRLRYCTVARFPYDFESAKEIARKVHLDTLFQVSHDIFWRAK